MAEQTQAEKDADLAGRVRDADVVILLTERGTQGVAIVKNGGGVANVPFDVSVSYGEKDDPPHTIRQIKVKAGWNRSDWRKMDRSALHEDVEADRG